MFSFLVSLERLLLLHGTIEPLNFLYIYIMIIILRYGVKKNKMLKLSLLKLNSFPTEETVRTAEIKNFLAKGLNIRINYERCYYEAAAGPALFQTYLLRIQSKY